MNPVIMIPSLNPDDNLVAYVERLLSAGFKHIIVINDGSSAEYDPFFEKVAAHEECVVLKHDVNHGKGRALKTGMEYYLANFAGFDGIVTGDADGQHTIEDTTRIAQMLAERQDALILGSRDFSGEDIPARSRFGNRTTSAVFKLMHGVWLEDTQTGLRGIPDSLVESLSTIEGERYEYEMNMLIDCAERKIPIIEEKIQTIYINDNSGSHFHPIRDSARIYWLILRNIILYAANSLFTSLLELVLLWVFEKTFFANADVSNAGRFAGIIGEGGVARIISSLVNYFINKKLVFKHKGQTAKSMSKYIILAVSNFFITYAIVALFSTMFGYEPFWVAPVVMVLMFIVTYTVQKVWVFKKEDDEK